MRLTCPNCDAQYEVDDKAIPPDGRDVQCSNCGHAWFQLPPDVEADLRDEARTFGDAKPEPDPEATPTPEAAPSAEAEPEAEPAPEAAPDPETDPNHEATPQATEAEPAPAPVQPRRPLDDGVKSLLREEAQREISARQAEGGTLESQPSLGLEEPETGAPSEEATRRRVAQMIDEAAEPPEEEPPAPETEAENGRTRRNLLPDIEEINSTLRPASERATGDPAAIGDEDEIPRARGGFRRGFLTVLLLALIGLGLYSYAPQIAARVPAAKPSLDSYVQVVDKGRLWLNGMMEKATRAINRQNGG